MVHLVTLFTYISVHRAFSAIIWSSVLASCLTLEMITAPVFLIMSAT